MKALFAPLCRSFFVATSLAASVLVCSAQSATSEADARALAIGRAYLRYDEALRKIAASEKEDPQWWRAPMNSTGSAESREERARAQREFQAELAKALGTAPQTVTNRDTRYTFLPAAKQALVAQIDQIYNERSNEVRRESMNTRLPSDGEKLRQIAAERDRELAAVLTPAEREAFELRTSSSASTIRQRFGEAIETEEELRKLFLLQKAFDEKFSTDEMIYAVRPQDVMQKRSAAERQLMADMTAAVGEERFALMRRAMDQDYQILRGLVARLKLPESTVDAVFKLRDNYSAQSLAIVGEASMNPMDRRNLLQELSRDARKELTALLTQAGMDIFAARGQWFRYLEQGTAFSMDPKDSMSPNFSMNQTVFTVSPSSGGRVISISSPVGSAPTATGGGGGGARGGGGPGTTPAAGGAPQPPIPEKK